MLSAAVWSPGRPNVIADTQNYHMIVWVSRDSLRWKLIPLELRNDFGLQLKFSDRYFFLLKSSNSDADQVQTRTFGSRCC